MLCREGTTYALQHRFLLHGQAVSLFLRRLILKPECYVQCYVLCN